MPVSLILNLSTDVQIPRDHLGRQAQAWFLHQMENISPTLSQLMHDGSGPKPYTISGLFHPSGNHHGDHFLHDGQIGLRVTAFSDEAEDIILNKWLTKMPADLRLWWIDFKLNGWTTDSTLHPWAGMDTYANLMRMGEQTTRDRTVSLNFNSPTAFRSEGVDIALPIPHHIFRGYWQKWNAYAPTPVQIQDIWHSFAEDCILVSGLRNLNTERLEFADGARGGAIGFTGGVSFALLPRNKCGTWAQIWDGSVEIMQTLAAFSFYCGTGHHTTIGLGQTQLDKSKGLSK